MSMLKLEKKVYNDGRTKQAFKDSCDINKILKKAQKTGSIAHLNKYPEAVYGEFEGYDLLEAYGRVQRAQSIFDDLPSEVRREFDGNALKFAGYASAPENRGRLAELLPAIAKPGSFFPNPIRRSVDEEVAVPPVVATDGPSDNPGGDVPAVPPVPPG